MKKNVFLLVLLFIGLYSMPSWSQIDLNKMQKTIKSNTKEKEETKKATNSKSERSSKTYVTGSSAGDAKLKAFQKKMEELETALATYKAFLNSDSKYDNKQNQHALVGENQSLRLTNKFIETNIDAPATELKNGKKYAPDYGFEEESKRYETLISTYTSLKEDSNKHALLYNESRKAYEYENSFDNASNKYVTQELFKEKPSDPIYSEMHQNNIGKIVFHTSMIDRNNPKGSFQGTFNASDRLYARAFLEKSFTNLTMYNAKGDSIRYADNNMAFPYTLIYIDGKKQDYKYDNVTITDNNQLKNNTRQIWLYPNVNDGLTDIKWIKSVDKLTVGKHQVKLEYYIFDPNEKGDYVAKIAEGAFTLVKNANDQLKIGKSWTNIKPLMSNTTLENAILDVAIKTSKLEDNLQPNAVKIMDRDWTVVKNKVTGAILHRIIVVQIKCSNTDGYCYTIPREAKQEYTGSGFSTTITLITHTNKHIGFEGYIDCN